MTRFFFHLASKDKTICDTKGREFGDLATAYRHAILPIHKMTLLDEVEWQGWSIKVTDVTNRSVLSVLFPQKPCLQYKDAPTKRIDSTA